MNIGDEFESVVDNLVDVLQGELAVLEEDIKGIESLKSSVE